jgi:hypothetical protein
MICPTCKVEMKFGKVIMPKNNARERTRSTPFWSATELKLVKCFKCPKCGHSDDGKLEYGKSNYE